MEVIGRRYDTKKAVRIEIDGPIVSEITDFDENSFAFDAAIPWITPGFVDLQVNGYAGQELTDAALTEEAMLSSSTAMDQFGVTGYLPTVTTAGFDVLKHSLRTIESACESSADVARRVLGIHLEGPYISLDDGPRGAHPLQHCRPPDWEEFQRLQDAAGGRIRIVMLSSEYERSEQFIARVVDHQVLVALGHTNASRDQIKRAVDAGARLSTHLGNGCHQRLDRHRNYI